LGEFAIYLRSLRSITIAEPVGVCNTGGKSKRKCGPQLAMMIHHFEAGNKIIIQIALEPCINL
jgi:hypothetical protein